MIDATTLSIPRFLESCPPSASRKINSRKRSHQRSTARHPSGLELVMRQLARNTCNHCLGIGHNRLQFSSRTIIEPVQANDALIPSNPFQVPSSRLGHLEIPLPSYLALSNATTQPIPPLHTLSRPMPPLFQPLQVPPVQIASLQLSPSRPWLPPAPSQKPSSRD